MKDRLMKVLRNEKCADGVFIMTLQADDFEEVRGGQFIHIALPDKTHILRRPFCIADYDKNNRTVTICYAIVGEGTRILSEVKAGEALKAIFPLGNGFKPDDNQKRIVILAGGMGTAVLPAIPTTWKDKEYYTFLGFGNKDKAVLVEELRAKSKEIHIATDDGSMGEKGFVTDLLMKEIDRIKPDAILCCGPEVMYKSLARVMQGRSEPVYISLEQRMGCGIGACLVCNCKVKSADGDKYMRVCVDGPVFKLEDVVL